MLLNDSLIEWSAFPRGLQLESANRWYHPTRRNRSPFPRFVWRRRRSRVSTSSRSEYVCMRAHCTSRVVSHFATRESVRKRACASASARASVVRRGERSLQEISTGRRRPRFPRISRPTHERSLSGCRRRCSLTRLYFRSEWPKMIRLVDYFAYIVNWSGHGNSVVTFRGTDHD